MRTWLISLSTSLDCLCRVLSVIGYQFAYWVTVGRADHSAVHHSVCVMPATGSTCQWASHCPVAQRDNDFATFWLPLPPVCQPFAIFYSHLFLPLSLSLACYLLLCHTVSAPASDGAVVVAVVAAKNQEEKSKRKLLVASVGRGQQQSE